MGRGKVIHVIGGAGGIGGWLIRHVFSNGCFVNAYDSNLRARSSRQVTYWQIEHPCGYRRFEGCFRSGDWIVLATPPSVLEATLLGLVHTVPPGCLFVTTASVQQSPLATLLRHVPGGSSRLGCHPLVGDSVPSPIGHSVVLTNFDESDNRHRAFRDILTAAGLLVTELSADAHDRVMASVQALTHFCLMGLNAALKADHSNSIDLRRVRTPNFQFTYAFASRVLRLSATTLGSIQSTTDARRMRTLFLDTLADLDRSLSGCNDTAECAQVIENLRSPTSGAEIAENAEIAALAVSGLQTFETQLHHYKTSEKPLVFRHRATKAIHIVRVMKVGLETVTFEESTQIADMDGQKWFLSGLTEAARENYRRVGRPIAPACRATIRKRNIELLTNEELEQFRSQILPGKVIRTFHNPHAYDREHFETWLPLLIPPLWQCQLLEEYSASGEPPRVLLNLIFDPDVAQKAVTAKVAAVVERRRLN